MFGQLGKWICALYRKKDESGKEFDLLVSEEGDVSCGGLETMIE